MGHKIKHHEPPNLLLGSATYASQLMGAHYNAHKLPPSLQNPGFGPVHMGHCSNLSSFTGQSLQLCTLLETKVDREQIWPGCSSLSSARLHNHAVCSRNSCLVKLPRGFYVAKLHEFIFSSSALKFYAPCVCALFL